MISNLSTGLKDATEKKLKKKAQEEDQSPWGKYLEKTKEKKRLKRSEIRKKVRNGIVLFRL